MQGQQTVDNHVGDDDACDAERQAGVRGDLRQRHRITLTESGDAVLVVTGEARLLHIGDACRKDRLDGDVSARLCAATSDRIRTDQ